MSSRRGLLGALLLCAAGAGLAVFAATRAWSVEVTVRPAPLSELRVTRTGGELLPWLPALGLVGLAGAGAVLATRSAARRLVGVLLLVVGLAAASGGAYGATLLDGAAPGWPLLCVLGGLLTAAGGAFTTTVGHRWPAMGGRYERPAAAGGGPVGPGRAVPFGADTTAVWDTLDRGEDPTEADPADLVAADSADPVTADSVDAASTAAASPGDPSGQRLGD